MGRHYVASAYSAARFDKVDVEIANQRRGETFSFWCRVGRQVRDLHNGGASG